MRELMIRRLRRAPIIKPLWDEFERMQADRNAAFAERDVALAVRDAALAACETALKERDAALAARRVELLPLNPTKKMLVDRLWQGNDPFRGFPDNLFEYDLQGWNSQHPYLSETIELLRPSVIVEIGVWKGGSTIYMAEHAKRLGLDTIVIAVDSWLGSSEHWLFPDFLSQMSLFEGRPALYYKFISNVIRAEVSDHVLPIPITSLGGAEILNALGVTASIIHLDASHDYESVMADLRAWWPILAPGGIFIGDDYPGWEGVKRAFDDFFGSLGLVPFEYHQEKCRVRKPKEADKG